MAFSKLYDSPAAAVGDIGDGSTLLVGGTSRHSEPTGLLAAVAASGASRLTCVCDFAGWDGADGLLELIRAGRVGKIISPCPFPEPDGDMVRQLVASGDLALEMAPQGSLAERLRAAGAGIGGVFVPVGTGGRFAEGKETRVINGVECVLEAPLRADYALLRASRADMVGNLVYRGDQRRWSAVMAAAARVAIVEADAIGEPGTIDPELVITPGIFVKRLVGVPKAAQEG